MKEEMKRRLTKWVAQNKLLLAIVITSFLLFLYGKVLSFNGYCLPEGIGFGSDIALSMLELREGILPWNFKPEEAEPEQVQVAALAEQNIGAKPEMGLESAEELLGITDLVDLMRIKDASEDENWMVLYDGSNSSEDDSQNMEFETVTDDYFSDAVFIGDSRMVGVYEYAGIEEATFYAKESMTIYGMMDSKVVTDSDARTVRDGLTQHQFAKVYIMVGINELGTADLDYFMDAYKEVLEEIKKLQPNAIIYIQAIMHVTGEKSRSDKIFNNANINARNIALKSLANGVDVFYIDVNEIYDDANGNLREEVSADDIHLLGNCYEDWHDFLYSHAIAWEYRPSETEENDVGEASDNDVEP